jgi:hypothetical protein
MQLMCAGRVASSSGAEARNRALAAAASCPSRPVPAQRLQVMSSRLGNLTWQCAGGFSLCATTAGDPGRTLRLFLTGRGECAPLSNTPGLAQPEAQAGPVVGTGPLLVEEQVRATPFCPLPKQS